MHIRGKTRARQVGAAATMAGLLATLAFAGSGQASASGSLTAEAGSTWSHLSEPGFGAVVTALSIDPHDGNHILIGGEMDGVFVSRDGGATFQPALGLRDYEIGEFTWVAARPNEVWVGTMGGPYVSRDGGGTWTSARLGFPNAENFCYSAPIERVAVDPNNPNHLIGFGGSQRQWENSCEGNRSAVWESTNAGASWIRKGQILAGVLGTAGGFVAGSSTTLLATVANGGVFKSTNGGATWTQASFGLPHGAAADIALHPTNPDRKSVV